MKTQFYAPVRNLNSQEFLHKDVRANDKPRWTTNPEEAKRYHDRRQAVHFARTNKFGLGWFLLIEVETTVHGTSFPVQ